MKLYILVLVVLCLVSLAAPAMAADLNATQTSYTEMQVDGTGFTSGATVTLSTTASIPVTASGGAYSYEITGIYLPADSVLKLDASPVNDDLKLYVKKYWPFAWTFDRSYSSIINYQYTLSTKNVHVHRSVPDSWIAGTFQTMRVYGTTAYSDVDLNVTVEQGVTAGGSGSFSETVDISAIPAGDYEIRATDGINTATTQVTIYAPGMLVAVAEPSHQTVNVSETANFDGSRSTGNVGIMSYKWDLGDGTNATGLTVSHTYSAAGPHTVTLTVYDAADSATDTCSVSVVSPPVEQNNTYSVNDTETTDGNNVTIHDTDISGDKPLNDTVLIVLDNGTLLVNIEVDEADNTTGVVTSVILDNTPVVDVSSNRTADIDLNLNSSVWAGGCPVLTTQIIYDLNDTVSGWNGTAVGTNATNEVTLAMSGLGLSDSGTAIMLHVNLSGINESDVLSLPISMTVDGDWYRDAADSTLTNVYLFKFCPNGTIKEQENPTGRHYDAANDTYTFYFVMPGFSTFALVGGKSTPSPTPSGGGGGGGTYPPGWFGTPTPTPTATPPPGVTPTPVGEKVTPTPAKPVDAGKTPTAPAKETPTKKKGIPGFTAVFVIAGMLAIAYMVMRRRR